MIDAINDDGKKIVQNFGQQLILSLVEANIILNIFDVFILHTYDIKILQSIQNIGTIKSLKIIENSKLMLQNCDIYVIFISMGYDICIGVKKIEILRKYYIIQLYLLYGDTNDGKNIIHNIMI